MVRIDEGTIDEAHQHLTVVDQTINGDVTIGDTSSDSLTINARLASDLDCNGNALTNVGSLVITGSFDISTLTITNVGAGTDPTLSSNSAAQLLTITGSLEVSGDVTWNSGTAFVGSLEHAITASRSWTFQDISGIIAQSGGAITLAGTAPTFSGNITNTVLVSASTVGAYVFGNYLLTPSLSNPAAIDVQIETAVGSESYVRATSSSVPAGNAQQTRSYAVFVPSGRRFRFAKNGFAGTTETIHSYSIMHI